MSMSSEVSTIHGSWVKRQVQLMKDSLRDIKKASQSLNICNILSVLNPCNLRNVRNLRSPILDLPLSGPTSEIKAHCISGNYPHLAMIRQFNLSNAVREFLYSSFSFFSFSTVPVAIISTATDVCKTLTPSPTSLERSLIIQLRVE